MNADDNLDERLTTVSRMFPERWKEGYIQRLKDNRLISSTWDEIPAGLDLDDPKQLAWWNGYYTAKLATWCAGHLERHA